MSVLPCWQRSTESKHMTTLPLYWILACIFTAFLSALVVWLFLSRRHAASEYRHDLRLQEQTAHSDLQQQQLQRLQADWQQLQTQYQQTAAALAQAQAENRTIREQILTKNLEAEQLQGLASENAQLQKTVSQLQQENARNQTLLQEEADAHQEKMQLLLSAREEMKLQFQQLATTILEEKSKRFLEQNQSSLNTLLNPVQEKMQQFGQLVQDSYLKEAKERGVLTQELQNLQQLNQQLNQEAQALTRALTGANNKTQGVWGEMILEKILEYSGLRKDHEYKLQVALERQADEGRRRFQPDALVYFPDEKCVVIDAKVSLNAYVSYVNTRDESEKSTHLKSHLASIRRHIKDLAEKRYHDLPEGVNLDFVLLFIPVEPAYLLALQEDPVLLQDAFNVNIMPVGPSNLLAVLRTVASVWRYENQSRNAQAIAEEGGKLYDKFVGMLASFEKLGNVLEQGSQTYKTAMNQMATGRGNVVSRIEKLREMGVKANKKIPEKYLQKDDEKLVLVKRDD